jgi:hypothetical protein
MKSRSIALTCLVFALVWPSVAPAATAQSGSNSQWVGMWQAQLDGVPSVILTLGDDTGQIAGAVVFNVVSREGGQPHILGHDAHVLMNPQLDGDTLHFQVIRRGDSRLLEMTVQITADGAAKFHCQNCGGEDPVVDMVREQVRPHSTIPDKH